MPSISLHTVAPARAETPSIQTQALTNALYPRRGPREKGKHEARSREDGRAAGAQTAHLSKALPRGGRGRGRWLPRVPFAPRPAEPWDAGWVGAEQTPHKAPAPDPLSHPASDDPLRWPLLRLTPPQPGRSAPEIKSAQRPRPQIPKSQSETAKRLMDISGRDPGSGLGTPDIVGGPTGADAEAARGTRPWYGSGVVGPAWRRRGGTVGGTGQRGDSGNRGAWETGEPPTQTQLSAQVRVPTPGRWQG